MAELNTDVSNIIQDVANKYRSHNMNAIEVGELISKLAKEHSITLDQLRVQLHEVHGIKIHSVGTLSKWRTVYDVYVGKWGLTIPELSNHEISKLYLIRDVFEPSTADMWFERMNNMTEGELLGEVNEAGAEGRKHYSLPLSVAGLVEQARAALSNDALGTAGALSSTAYQEIVAQLVIDMGALRRREIYALMHGEAAPGNE